MRGRKNFYFGFPVVWTDSPVWPVRSDETLSWGISRLRYCDPRYFGLWTIVMKWCTSFWTRLGVQVRGFSAYFGYFTKWDRTTSWYLEITSSLAFNLLEDITWPRRDTEFLFEYSKTFREWALPFELFCDEFKVTKCCTKAFCLC